MGLTTKTMKRFLYPSMYVIIAVLSTASMCKTDDDNVIVNQKLATTLGNGSWRITYFFNNQDVTSDFDGYSFQFIDDGILIARKNALSMQGSWETEESSDGNSKLYIDFGTGDPLQKLNEDWRLGANSGLKITFEHQSGNGDIDTMVLQRN